MSLQTEQGGHKQGHRQTILVFNSPILWYHRSSSVKKDTAATYRCCGSHRKHLRRRGHVQPNIENGIQRWRPCPSHPQLSSSAIQFCPLLASPCPGSPYCWLALLYSMFTTCLGSKSPSFLPKATYFRTYPSSPGPIIHLWQAPANYSFVSSLLMISKLQNCSFPPLPKQVGW